MATRRDQHRRAAGPAEHADRGTNNAAESKLGAGEHAAKAGPDLFGGAANSVEQLWRSGFDVASHFAERSSRQLARSIGVPEDKACQATEQSSRNIEFVVQSSRAYADAFQSISRELSSFCNQRVDRNIEKMSALMRSRTPEELIAAQSDLLRDNIEGFAQTSRSLVKAFADVADKATRRLTEITRRAA